MDLSIRILSKGSGRNVWFWGFLYGAYRAYKGSTMGFACGGFKGLGGLERRLRLTSG